MAIYSLNHSSVGRSTQKRAGTAGAHAKYVLRPSAAREVIGENMPTDRAGAQAWLDQQESSSRKNERVIDKLRLVLSRELDERQRSELVRDYAQAVGKGRASWVAGIHDQGKDAANPHAHLIIRDRDFETGKKVAELSSKGSTDRLRELWETKANEALERAGRSERIDRRTLKAQGIDREATIHVGPAVRAMAEKGERPQSQERPRPPRHRRKDHAPPPPIRYPEIDQGRTRSEFNAQVVDLNAEREKRRQNSQAQADQVEQVAPPDPLAERHRRELVELDKAEAAAKIALEKRIEAQAKAPQPQPEKAPVRPSPQPERQTGFLGRVGSFFGRVVGKGTKPKKAPVVPINEPQQPQRQQPREPQADPETLWQQFNDQWAARRQEALERMEKERELARGPILDPTEQRERSKARGGREGGGRWIGEGDERR